MPPKPLADLGAGLSSQSPLDHPAGPPQHGTFGQIERTFTAGSTFLSGMLAISASQILGAPLKAIDPKFYESYIAFTKQSFGVLITTMTQWWSPTVVRVSGDRSIPKQLFRKPDGTLECRFPKRLVMMANHQLYTDWLYLWWVAYTNQMHGYIYIILKESLKNVPIVGWGAQFYNFIFLSRKWEQDKAKFGSQLDQLNTSNPMWLLIFPEGTNLAKETREVSKEWADKKGLQDMKHQLLPRSKGLQFSLQRLQTTTEWLYDCTIGYEGIPPGQFGQDIFTLRSSLFEGRPPKAVCMHFRRFKISTIPIDNDKAFDVWLRNRWREKDYMLEHFVRFNRFPEDDKWMISGKTNPRPAKFIETQIKSNNMEEFLSIFAPLASALTLLSVAYGGANPKDLMEMLTGSAKNGSNQLKLLQNGLTDDNLQKLQHQIPSGIGPNTGLGLNEAAQKDFIQKYLNSMRPTISKQITLQDHQLRPQSKALSTKPPSISQTSVSRGSTTHPKSVVSGPKSLPTKQPPNRTIRNPPLKKSTHTTSSRAQPDRKTTTLEQSSLKSNSKTSPEKSNTKKSSQSVTIDPKMLARMKGPKALEGKPVSVNPSILKKAGKPNGKA